MTIDYQAWNLSQPPCNLFAIATNVPATIGGSSGTIEHQTRIGQPIYDTTDKSVQLDCRYVSTTSSLGTRYRLSYSFKQGYGYKITITAAKLTQATVPYLRLDINNNGGGGNTVCNGPGGINPDFSGSPDPKLITGLNFADYEFIFSPLNSTLPTLEVAAIPQTNGTLNTVRIRKIIIIEIPPPPTFTITPSPIPVVCGKSNTVTLTINNVYNTPGVTGYTWNLGTGNTWIYNGSAAPATIPTTTNTLTLSPTCGVTPGNVSATVSVGTLTYQTNTATINSTNETLSISGTNPLCSGSAVYSVANLPTCGATVTGWSASPSGIVSVTDNGNNTATITKLADGQVTITATVNLTNACNTSAINLSFPLSCGAFQLTGYYYINSNYHQPVQRPLYTNNSPIWLPANQSFGVTAYITNPNLPSPVWARAASSYPFSWSPAGVQLNFSGTSGSTAYNQRNGTFEFTTNTGCGVTTTTFNWPVIVQGWSFSVTASPNPATENLIVSIIDEPAEVNAPGKNETITMNLYNLNNTVVINRWIFKNNQSKFSLNISDVKKGHYILVVQKGKYQQSKQIIIE